MYTELNLAHKRKNSILVYYKLLNQPKLTLGSRSWEALLSGVLRIAEGRSSREEGVNRVGDSLVSNSMSASKNK